MVPNEGAHLLVAISHGQTQVYCCTLKNAKAILAQHEDRLSADIAELAQALAQPTTDFTVMPSETLVRGLDELLTATTGKALPHLRKLLYGRAPEEGEDCRPQYEATSAHKEELALWLFRNGRAVNDRTGLSAEALKTLRPQEELSFLAPLLARHEKPLRFVSRDTLSAARDLIVLRADKWRDTAPEHRIVERYVAFINQWLVDPRDERYEVVALETVYR